MKYINLLLAFLVAGILFAQPNFMPVTTIAEDFGSLSCPNCLVAWQGLQAVHSETHNGEFITARLFTESGSLSNAEIEERFSYYGVIGLPNVIFNGLISIEGAGEGTADGTNYLNALSQTRFSASPVKIDITDFSLGRGAVSANVTMLSPTAVISNAKLVYYLLEDNVGSETNVLRGVLYDDIASLSGAGTTLNFNRTFDLNPDWSVSNLWGLIFLQLSDKTIVQCVSSLPLPEHNFRVAMDWKTSVTVEPNTNYLSSPIWLFNLGAADNYTMSIQVDNAPADWYFNYCDEEGNCYPGSIDRPFTLAAGEATSIHLNLMIGSSGTADFRIAVNSPHIGSYNVPFHITASTPIIDDTNTLSPYIIKGFYPNPVKSSAVFHLSNPKNVGSATIEIYNVKGQKVQTLKETNLHSGENEISFVPDTNLPNGIYYYRLQNSNSKAGRFIIMK